MTDDGLVLGTRAIATVSGEDAVSFLANLVTGRIEGLAPGEASSAALLTPQGKILFDFLVVRTPEGFLIDAPAAQAVDLIRRLGFYKLRAKVTVAAAPDLAVRVLAPATDAGATVARFADPRLSALGHRAIEHATGRADDDQAYRRLRIDLGVPEGGLDYAYGEAFPADVNMDLLQGVDFTKGCFVGQEVVARMHHKTVARRRVIKVTGDAPLPAMGTEIMVDGKAAGTLGGSVGTTGLALVRLDRIGEALAAGTPILAEGVSLTPHLPAYANFGWTA